MATTTERWDETMKELTLWELKWGRSTTRTQIIAADGFGQATMLSVEYIKDAMPDWKEVSVNDINALKNLDQSVITSSKGEKI